jgi:hypothetical protein
MSVVVAPPKPQTAADPRLAAFTRIGCPEVFHAVASPSGIAQTDPYDVETIHADARAAFERLLNRGRRVPSPPSGAVLVLQGESGSGKTHLMRAFRTRAHSQGAGYCGYLQMTSEIGNYARYMLAQFVDGLDQPYAPDGPSRTGLARLSAGLLELVPGLTGVAAGAFRDGEVPDPAALVDDYADRLQSADRFRDCDVELLRVMLHLERNDPQVRSRAMMWLRCQEMTPRDRDRIGGAVPRTDDADPGRMLRALAKLTDAVHGAAMVLLVDQLEDMANQSAPVERFRKVVDALTAFTDQIPNALVVLACLEDYFKENSAHLIKAKQDRLERDPEPIKLLSNRTLDEIRAMTARRLAHLYDEAGVEADAGNELFPFRDAHLIPLQGMRTRDALDFLRRHHERCIAAGEWSEPPTPATDRGNAPATVPPPPSAVELDPLWNDFHSTFAAAVPDEEGELAAILAAAIAAAAGELPDGYHFGRPEADENLLEVEIHKPGDAIDKLLVAICNGKPQGGGLGKQLTAVERRLGDFPVALVRTTEFPTTKTSLVVKQIGAMLKKDGRRVVAADADWRRMMAFDEFRKKHAGRPDFAAWQKMSRPLGDLDSLQKILRLNSFKPVAAVPSAPPPAVEKPTPPPPVPVPPTAVEGIAVGRTRGALPTPVAFEPVEFCQHAAFLGGSGSGKTTAALNLVEQLLGRGVPVVLLDRKGDLCRYADPAAWQRPLADPARAARRQALRAALDVAVYTPGKAAGRPLALPVVPAGFADLRADEREQVAQFAAGALGTMIGFKTSDADKAQRAILAKAIETLAATPGAAVTLPALQGLIEDQDDALLNAIGGQFPAKYFAALAQRLLTLELNNKTLLNDGERLDVDALLGTGPHARPGRVRLSVVSTRFLGDAAKVDFWVSQLLVAVSRWCAKSPKPHLQAVFLFDEADAYLPATRKPATKEPMEDLLKRARSAGVGVFLATQSPGDLDYKCKENVRNWFVGRVKEKTALEKLRPLFAAAKGDPLGKLAGQGPGEFFLVREASAVPVLSDESLVRTEQLAEEQIAALARDSHRPG